MVRVDPWQGSTDSRWVPPELGRPRLDNGHGGNVLGARVLPARALQPQNCSRLRDLFESVVSAPSCHFYQQVVEEEWKGPSNICVGHLCCCAGLFKASWFLHRQVCLKCGERRRYLGILSGYWVKSEELAKLSELQRAERELSRK